MARVQPNTISVTTSSRAIGEWLRRVYMSEQPIEILGESFRLGAASVSAGHDGETSRFDGWAAPKPEWTGEGMPPVGTVCEVAKKCQGCTWQRVEIAYMGSEFFIAVCPERRVEEPCRHSHGYQFRPIRTPEQIAAEERAKAIEDMRETTRRKEHPFDYWIDPDIAGELYDAGYRKQVKP